MATQVETVKLSDGRIVDFAGKRKMLKESFIAQDGTVTTRFDFRNGETRSFTIPPAMLAKFAGHGAEQKIGDETAGVEDPDDMVIAVDDIMGRLTKGEWNVRREGTGGGFAGASVLVKALVEYTKKPVEAVKEYLSKKTQAEKLALRNSAQLKPIVQRIEDERAASKGVKVDTEALLEELS